jgi:hypothetical protein
VIDQMTLAEAAEIFRYWEAHPPVHLLVAAVFGVKAKPVAPEGSGLPPGFAVSQVAAFGMPAPVFDLNEMRTRNRARAIDIARRNALQDRSSELSSIDETA